MKTLAPFFALALAAPSLAGDSVTRAQAQAIIEDVRSAGSAHAAQTTQGAAGDSRAPAALAWHTSMAAAEEEAERTKRPILAHFTLPGCMPCAVWEKYLDQPAVAAELRRFVLFRGDARRLEYRTRFGVRSAPMQVLIVDGRVAAVWSGWDEKRKRNYLPQLRAAAKPKGDGL